MSVLEAPDHLGSTLGPLIFGNYRNPGDFTTHSQKEIPLLNMKLMQRDNRELDASWRIALKANDFWKLEQTGCLILRLPSALFALGGRAPDPALAGPGTLCCWQAFHCALQACQIEWSYTPQASQDKCKSRSKHVTCRSRAGYLGTRLPRGCAVVAVSNIAS